MLKRSAEKLKTTLTALVSLLIWSVSLFGEDVAAKGKEFEGLLDDVHLRFISFEEDDEITFLVAVSLAVSKAIELDSSAGKNPRSGIGRFVADTNKHIKDCVVFPKSVEDIEIVYSARDLTLRTFVVELAKQSEMDLYTSSSGLVFCPAGKDPVKEFADQRLSIWSTVFKVAPETKTDAEQDAAPQIRPR